ncbi:MAG: hypothetical protein F7C35_08590 [Desulfurococcales archaeon]|nr:hypothetical protein [Desulfurococcales archaeon]
MEEGAVGELLGRLVAVYTSHKESPLEVIGRLETEVDTIYESVEAEGVVVLATCNRFEVYMDTPRGGSVDRVLRVIEEAGGNPRVVWGVEAARRLLRIAAGLESQIIGEPEILGQVRQAIQRSRELGRVSSFLEIVFRSALMAGRRVRRETPLGRSRVGYPSAAVSLAYRLAGNVRNALIVGTGKAARRVLAILCRRGPERVVVSSRSLERAAALSNMCEYAVATTIEGIRDHAPYDVAFVAVTGYRPPGYIPEISRFVVDLSNPPVFSGDNVFGMDDLRGEIEEAIRGNLRFVPQAEMIVEEELESLIRKIAEMRVSSVIRALLEYSRHITEEVSHDGVRRHVELAVSRLLHPILVSLRRASVEGSSFEHFLSILMEELEGRGEYSVRAPRVPSK